MQLLLLRDIVPHVFEKQYKKKEQAKQDSYNYHIICFKISPKLIFNVHLRKALP